MTNLGVLSVVIMLISAGFLCGVGVVLTALRSYSIEVICRHIANGDHFRILLFSKKYDWETGEYVGRVPIRGGWWSI